MRKRLGKLLEKQMSRTNYSQHTCRWISLQLDGIEEKPASHLHQQKSLKKQWTDNIDSEDYFT